MLHFRATLAMLVLLAAPSVPVLAQNGKSAVSPTGADDRFLAARDAFRAGQRAKLAEQAQHLHGYVLEPYVEYYQLRMRLDELATGPVRDFLARNAGTYVAEQLRREWLVVLGKRRDWIQFEADYPGVVADDAELTCYASLARVQRGEAATLDEFNRVWAAPRDLPEGCVAIAERQIAAGKLTQRHLWDRTRRLLEAGQLGAARRMINYLPASESPDDRALDAIQKAPDKFLDRAEKLDLKKRANRELLLFALSRAARTDAELALSYFPRTLQERLPAEDQAWAWAQIATGAAKQHLPKASEWFARADSVGLNEEQVEWRARAALRADRWAEVRATIDRMAPAQQGQSTWLYWNARALRALGERPEADQLFARIAEEHGFYGKLAREELGLPFAALPRGRSPAAEDLSEAAASPGLQRALALFRLGMRTEAVREWNWTLRGMDDRQLLAAAELARRAAIWDRAINTADRTVGMHDFDVRFLAPYRDVFAQQSRAQGLEEPWVLALVRQESRFVVDARSVAGASGLMQLMPATARWVAKQSGMKDFAWSRVTDVDVNVALGTSYLKYVLDELDGSPVLASAAYNAGPGRARRWKADRPLEGAVYAETIPFNETRDYVKKVMSNTMYYAALFGSEGGSLKSRLGRIAPRRGGEGYAATITGQPTVQ